MEVDMKCDEVYENIIPYYTNELSKAKAEEYRRHTMICKKCARYAFKIRDAINYATQNKQPIVKVDLLKEKL
jgi:anti-sigma factor RsiW